jgi:hypothetical protein
VLWVTHVEGTFATEQIKLPHWKNWGWFNLGWEQNYGFLAGDTLKNLFHEMTQIVRIYFFRRSSRSVENWRVVIVVTASAGVLNVDVTLGNRKSTAAMPAAIVEPDGHAMHFHWIWWSWQGRMRSHLSWSLGIACVKAEREKALILLICPLCRLSRGYQRWWAWHAIPLGSLGQAKGFWSRSRGRRTHYAASPASG